MSNARPPLPPELQLALQRGDLLGAIKAIRSVGRMDLQAAKRAVEQQVREQAQRQAVEARAHADGGKHELEAVADQVRAAARRAAQAKRVRERPPTIEMGDRPGDMRWVLIVAALLAAAVWVVFGGS